MNFATRAFFVYLPIVLAVYHLARTRTTKYRLLLAASWIFYLSWNPWFLWVIIFPTVVDYFAGLLIEAAPTPGRRRLWLAASIVANLGLLAGFKYTKFVVENACGVVGWTAPPWVEHIILPLGISFHTFQGISYTLDVYRRKIAAVRSFTDFALFVAFFPQLVAGPIVRAVEFLPQMVTPPRVSASQVVEGFHYFIVGLFKKVFIADQLATFVDAVFKDPTRYGAATHRWAVVAYACQIYCDFAGYSDMAIGCAKWFGFELPENFRLPYLSRSIGEFWRRWHITLSTWMRDYLYISLGGSRQGGTRTAMNLIATMTLCGLWHGASWNYVLWGFYNGVLLAGHRIWDRALTGRAAFDGVRSTALYQAVAWAATMLQVLTGLVLVRSESWAGCWLVQGSLVGRAVSGTYSLPALVPLLIGLVALGHWLGGWRGVRAGLELPAPLRAGVYVAAVALIVVLGPDVGKAFIYFQF
ncbi:MAG TPA: MBOAT family protein [Gemmataceae bacterium]|nr:MBOAT family protein [Gemmataceae bacterium]